MVLLDHGYEDLVVPLLLELGLPVLDLIQFVVVKAAGGLAAGETEKLIPLLLGHL